jgi:ABC-type amino acid transport substrate-binding protein
MHKRFKHSLRIFLLLSMCIFGGPLALSAKAIEPVEVLRVGTPADYFPYASMNPETGRPQGYDVDLTRKALLGEIRPHNVVQAGHRPQRR